MICFLHGYLLDGSGSNLWTRIVLATLARKGETIHVFCQEPHPEAFPFISEAYKYQKDGSVEKFYENKSLRDSGKVVLHKPVFGHTLPVYVKDRYEEFERVVPMIELSDEEIEEYLSTNIEALKKVIQAHEITRLHANHTVLMSVVAERIHHETGIPYVVMPHGSAIEYAVKKDKRMWNFAHSALSNANKIIVSSSEVRERLENVFPEQQEEFSAKITEVPLGVDTSLFQIAEDRAAELKKLNAYLDTLPLSDGKTEQQTKKLIADFSFEEGLEKHIRYDIKNRDQELQEKITRIGFPLMLYIGRLIAEKGTHTILFALPEVQRIHPDLNLGIVGHGPLREIGELLLDALARGDGEKIEKLVEWADLKEAEYFIKDKKDKGTWNNYLETAKTHLDLEKVHFFGYLKHEELSPLLSCSDIGCFPSMVAESGPLVFLEAIASGCFPMGTYMAGMKASIDRLENILPTDDLDLMKIDPRPSKVIQSQIEKIPKALEIAGKHRTKLREIAVTHFDWEMIVQRLIKTFDESDVVN